MRRDLSATSRSIFPMRARDTHAGKLGRQHQTRSVQLGRVLNYSATFARFSRILTRSSSASPRSKSSSSASAMSKQLISLQKTIASLRAAAIDQQNQVESLATELASTKRERDDLAGQVVTMTDEANLVYMVAKPLPDLLKSGILVEEGGRKGFLGLGGKKGQTLVPGRNLRESDFTTLNMTADSVLILQPGHSYRIASRHNGELLSPGPNPNGILPSRMRILDPARFWATSRFLILIER